MAMLDIARGVADVPRAMLVFLEEDYLFHPDMLVRLVDFWAAYDPCALVPYDNPDRYTRTDNLGFGAETILHTPGMHWRTVESSTVTFVMRMDAFQALDRRGLVPAPWDDRGRSRQVSALLGLWGPMPSLAGHVHWDCVDPCVLTDPNFDYLAYKELLLREAARLGFPEERARG